MWQQDEACRKHLARSSQRTYQFHHGLPYPSSEAALLHEEPKPERPLLPTKDNVGYRRFFAFLTTFQPKIRR